MDEYAQELAAYVREHAIPVPVAIITYGDMTHGHSINASKITDESDIVAFRVDLRQVMRDPGADGVSYDEDGSSPKTILSVFGQNTFMDAVKEVVYGVFSSAEQMTCNPERKGVVALINCTKGCHRSNTIGRATKECLNFIQNGDGNRVFNVECFHMFRVKPSEQRRAIASAKTWATGPWAMIAEPLDRGYGHDVVSQRIESQRNYDDMWSMMAAINTNHETENGNWVMLAGTPEPACADAAATELDDVPRAPRPSSKGGSRRPTTPPRSADNSNADEPSKKVLKLDTVVKQRPPAGPTPPSTAPPAYLKGGEAADAAASAAAAVPPPAAAAAPSTDVMAALQGVVMALQAQQAAPPPAVPAAPPPPPTVPKFVPPSASPFATPTPSAQSANPQARLLTITYTSTSTFGKRALPHGVGEGGGGLGQV